MKNVEKKSAGKKVTTNAPARKKGVSFSEELVSSILARIADGESVNKICSGADMPTRKSFFEWVLNDPELQRRYELAIVARTDYYAEEIIQIADDGMNDSYVDDQGNNRVDNDVIARSKLRVDARKWFVSKMNPKKYGDKIAIDADVKVTPKMDEVEARIAQLQALMAKKS